MKSCENDLYKASGLKEIFEPEVVVKLTIEELRYLNRLISLDILSSKARKTTSKKVFCKNKMLKGIDQLTKEGKKCFNCNEWKTISNFEPTEVKHLLKGGQTHGFCCKECTDARK